MSRRPRMKLLRPSFPAALLVLAIALAVGRPAYAHQGPPFPIIMDRPTPHFSVSVWTDPDIGEGTFWVMLEPTGDAGSVPEPQVSVWVRPVSGRLERVTYPAARQSLRGQIQFVAKPGFDQQEQWAVGIVIQSPGEKPVELFSQVEATPPGLGPWDLLIYAFPFAALAILWIVAVVRRGRRSAASESLRGNAREAHETITAGDLRSGHPEGGP